MVRNTSGVIVTMVFSTTIAGFADSGLTLKVSAGSLQNILICLEVDGPTLGT
jgi:hypothetical protein